MRTSAAQRRAVKRHATRRKASRAPRTEDLQRAIAQAMRSVWPDFYRSAEARALMKAIAYGAESRLIRRGFDNKAVGARIVRMLLSPKVIHRDGRVDDGVAEADRLGIRIPEHRR